MTTAISFRNALLAGAAIVAVATPSAALAQAVAFNIEPQPLAAGLQEFARQTDVELLYAPELDYMQAPDVDIHVGLKSSNLIAQLQACIAGAGLCVLPRFLADPRRDLRQVLPDQVGLTRSLWLVTHADLKDLARVRTVSDFILDQVKAEKARF